MDQRTFDEFVAERATAMLRTAYLLTGDRGSARDLLQTALIAADRHRDRFADPAEATAFVRRELVAEHTSWRRWLRLGDLLSESPVMAGAAGFPGFPARRPADPGPQDEFSAPLAQLPPRVRAALVLRYAEGASGADTAAALGRPIEEVAIDTARGLDRLGTDGARLGRVLTERAQSTTAVPDEVRASTREGAQAQRNHRLALLVLAAVLIAIALIVVVTV